MQSGMELNRGWRRYELLAGIVAVALWLIATAITEGAATTDADTPQQMLAAYRDDTGLILTGSFLFMLGSAFFLWFVDSLRSRLVAAEGEPAHLSGIAFAGGIATAVCLLLVPAPHVAGAVNEDDLTAEVAQTLSVIDDAFFVAAEVVAIVLLVATGLLALRTGVLPRWLAWVSFLIAVVLFTPIGWLALLIAFPLWLVAVSVLLMLRARGSEREMAGARTGPESLSP